MHTERSTLPSAIRARPAEILPSIDRWLRNAGMVVDAKGSLERTMEARQPTCDCATRVD